MRTSSWPPLSAAFLAQFQSAGQNYRKATPTPDEVHVVDFFSGAGGMSLGFHGTRQSGLAYRYLAAIDIDSQALETLRANLPIKTYELDVRHLADDPSKLVELIPELDRVTYTAPLVFIGCPPCQGFSAHRKKDDRDDLRNSLITSFAELVLYFRPDIVVMENVPEMLMGRYQRYYEEAASRLRDAGYILSEAVLDTSLYGVPQRRRRAVVLGSRHGRIAMPSPVLRSDDVRTVRDAISHLPAVSAGETDRRDPWHRAPAHVERVLKKIRQIPPDGGDRRHLPSGEQLECHVGMDAGETTGFTDVYGRLRWDKPSVTITAKSSTPSCGRFLHPEQHRNITIREAALLQSFPHNYIFTGGFVRQYRQIGEAVPPLFARHLAFAVLDHLRPLPRRVVEVKERVASAATDAAAAPARVVAVDLFCGAGGLSLGMEAAGIPTVYAADLDAAAIATFEKNLGPNAEVRDVRDEDLLATIADRVGDNRFVLVGGPPCQGFSQQRRGSNDDPRNDLVLRYGEVATFLPNRPAAIVLENVMYLDSPRGRRILESYIQVLTAHGYTVQRFDLNSADFGLPQTRKRIVVIAVDVTYKDNLVGPRPSNRGRWLTIGEVLAGLPIAAASQFPNHIASQESPLNVRRMSYVDMGRGRTAIPQHLQLACHRGYDGHLDVFGRLDWFEFARTITGGFDSSSRGEYTHPFANRSITAREAARLQGFPDHFIFLGNKADVRRQIGNAVPPPLAYAIGEAILNSLEGG
jgi:DNA (cytosine-5)-methyltransferase 1